MKAEIVCIGTELLLGQIVDTNAAFLARGLAELGIDLFHKTTVGDNLDRIIATFKLAWERSDVILVSGGLGPTQDDLTREAVAGFLGEELDFNDEAWKQVCAYFEKVQRPFPESNRRQAMFPKSGIIIINGFGTAPGLLVEKENRYLMALPGVPQELKAMWNETVKPYLKNLLIRENNPVLTSRTIRMVGIGESAMEKQIIDLIQGQTNPTIAPYANLGEASLRLTAKSLSETENIHSIETTTDLIKERLGPYIYGYDADNLESVVGRLLSAAGWRLAVAESCTGGLITHRITNISGSSDYFLGGINSYSNQLKINLLGVPEQIIIQNGAVSPETAQAMAKGIRQKTGAEVGLATTGIAGPTGGTAEKPVGLVYLAIDLPGKAMAEKRIFPFDRLGNKESAAQAALVLLWQNLKN